MAALVRSRRLYAWLDSGMLGAVMNLLARVAPSRFVNVVSHAYVIRLPWWVLLAIGATIAIAVALIWLITRRPRR